MVLEKTIQPEKVDKEVNTINFDEDPIDAILCRTRLQQEEEFKYNKYRVEEEPPLAETSRKHRKFFLHEAENDEIKAKIETSKSDWELKMKKIAELEMTTREALNEMQTRSTHRKTFHRSLDRNTKRTYFDEHYRREDSPEEHRIPKIRLDSKEPSASDDTSYRKLKNSSRSFDIITSRTEKLLGNTLEFERPLESSSKKTFSFEQEYRKSKDSTSKFKKLIEESYGKEVEPSDFEYDSRRYETKPSEFFSDLSTPDRSFKSASSYSDGFKSEKYSSQAAGDWKENKYESSDLARATQNGSISSQAKYSRRTFSPERKKDEDSSDSHSTKSTFNPFPRRAPSRPKELGVKLGLYPTSPDGRTKRL